MNTKLTLTIERDIIERAKEYAKLKERSLSDMIENYLKALVKEKNTEKIESSPIVKSLRGSFQVPKEFDEKQELSKQLLKKYSEV